MVGVYNTNVAGVGPTRIGLTQLTTAAQRFRFCTLLDDLSYNENGSSVVTGGVVERGGRYNTSAVLQRQPNGQIGLTVLVFDGRSGSYIPNSSETIYLPGTAVGQQDLQFPTTTTLSFDYSRHLTNTERPAIGKGRWIALYTPASQFLEFYRIASVDDSSDPVLQIELQNPIRPEHTTTGTNLIVFSGLAEVFVRPPLTNK
jgi:hypothetical protein